MTAAAAPAASNRQPAADRSFVVKSFLFSAPMIRALLARRKLETRRLASNAGAAAIVAAFGGGARVLIWVREAFRLEENFDSAPPSALAATSFSELPVWHEADHGAPSKATRSRWDRPFGRLRPAIHMPRWASRLTLAVEAAGVAPLQTIDDAGALSEGVTRYRRDGRALCGIEVDRGRFIAEAETPRESFRLFWDHLHKDNPPARWEANPDVAAIRFRVHAENIDALIRRLA